MRIISWNMNAAFGSAHALQASAWRYLSELDPDVALLQEAIIPKEARDQWPGQLFARKHPTGRQLWGTAILSKDPHLAVPHEVAESYWLQQVSGGAVVARSSCADDLWLVSVHSSDRPRRPEEFAPDHLGSLRQCRPREVWEVEAAVAGLEPLLMGRRFVIGGDLNSSVLFDEGRVRKVAAIMFDNLAAAGLHDLRPRFFAEEQRTWFRKNTRPFQLDHIYADAKTETQVSEWRVITEAAETLGLSDHAPVEVVVSP